MYLHTQAGVKTSAFLRVRCDCSSWDLLARGLRSIDARESGVISSLGFVLKKRRKIFAYKFVVKVQQFIFLKLS